MNKLIVVKASGKFYFSEFKADSGYHRYRSLPENFLVNGKRPEPAFIEGWQCLDEMPEKIEVERRDEIERRFFSLKDPELASDKFPLEVKYEDAVTEELDYKDWFCEISSLYESKLIYKPSYFKLLPYDIQLVASEEDFHDPVDFNFPVKWDKLAWEVGKNEGFVTANEVKYTLLTHLTTPPVLMHMQPCAIGPDRLFRIVREYIKSNIEPKYARIKSDYFKEFSVEKVIPLSEPYEFTYDENAAHNLLSKRKRKPKYKRALASNRSIVVYSITPTSLTELQAPNQKALSQRIQEYCQKVVDFINKPLVDCPHCQGDGVLCEERLS